MAQNSTNMIARVGGETKITSLFGNLMNQLVNQFVHSLINESNIINELII